MNQFKDQPERGNLKGVYVITDLDGNEQELVAESFPQADAYVRMQATYKMSISEWRERELQKKLKEVEKAKKPKEAKKATPKTEETELKSSTPKDETAEETTEKEIKSDEN